MITPLAAFWRFTMPSVTMMNLFARCRVICRYIFDAYPPCRAAAYSDIKQAPAKRADAATGLRHFTFFRFSLVADFYFAPLHFIFPPLLS